MYEYSHCGRAQAVVAQNKGKKRRNSALTCNEKKGKTKKKIVVHLESCVTTIFCLFCRIRIREAGFSLNVSFSFRDYHTSSRRTTRTHFARCLFPPLTLPLLLTHTNRTVMFYLPPPIPFTTVFPHFYGLGANALHSFFFPPLLTIAHPPTARSSSTHKKRAASDIGKVASFLVP